MSSNLKYLAIAVVLVVAGSAVAYEVVTSQTPGNPCASFTPDQLGANATQGVVSGDTTPNFAAATTVHGSIDPLAFGTVIQVVAGENFWGSLLGQLGGNLTSVLSIVSDPNADPHEYEANASDGAAIAEANFVVVNGVGYDDWALQLINASDTNHQVVLNVGVLNGVSVTGGIVTGNPHQWYNPLYVNHTLLAMYSDLVALEPSATSVFQQNFANLNTSTGGGAQGVSIDQLYARANQIRDEFKGTVVASTESIFVYLANYTGLDLISPQPFMEAVAEGNDPPTQSVTQFQCQLESGNVKVLVYNIQTVTPITTSMKAVAAQHNVSVTFVSETIQPSDTSFQDWMYGQYNQLENALNAYQLGQ
ncbi:MAG: zinc ABC transporter substrate-binding protein [Thermoplasmata archaeon]|nr:zinc ABC transporter substrate-binding protein [Thermoplasmata archaeon]